MEYRVLEKRGRIIGVERVGVIKPWGFSLLKYTTDGGKFLESWYADHTCEMNHFDKAVPKERVDPEMLEILELGTIEKLLEAQQKGQYKKYKIEKIK
ncbi:MAG: hypothetical protein V1744_05400 [Candidatus Altiarchaeota archaeon]